MDRRAWRLDLAAGFLLLAGTALALAVLSYDPADLPGQVYPPHAFPRNLLGLPGAVVAGVLIQALGAAVFAWLALWFLAVLVLFLRRDWRSWLCRLAGWFLLVPACACLADRWGSGLPPTAVVCPPVPGVGGSIGAWLNFWLADQLPPPASAALVLSCAGVGLALGAGFAGRWALRGLALTRFAGRGLLSRLRLAFPRRVTLPPIRTPREVPVLEGESAPLFPVTPPASTASIPILVGDEPLPASAEVGPEAVSAPQPTLGPALPEALPPDEPVLESSPPATPTTGLYSERHRFRDFELPPLTLLEEARPVNYTEHEQQLRERAALLEKTFADFDINVRVVGINTGPVITQYEVTLETGLRVSKVTRMAEDIALNLKVPSVRMVAPIPGKNAVGIEVPNDQRADVRLKEVLHSAGARVGKCKIPLFLGKDAEGRALVHDLAEMPHLLIAGTTGTGKSVCLNAVILSMLMTRRPDELKMILLDPKGGVEMEQFSRVPHLMCPVVTDMKKSEAILSWAVDKMEERYDLLRRSRVRNIAGYNELGAEEILRRIDPDEVERPHVPEHMPYLVLLIDEMADLMMQFKKEVEGHIIRLAQKSRAAGIHLVVATQKPTVDVITGLIKSNLPSRICFKVASKSDSRVVLDAMGADRLLGKGDMLFLPPGTSSLVRAQGTYASDAEIQRVTGSIECEPCYEKELMQLKTKDDPEEEGSLQEKLKSRDKLYEQAIEVVIREGRGSVSLLQRALGIGYGRASRLVDFMATDGIVGGYNGSNAREVLYTPEQWAALKTGSEESAA